MNHDELKDLIAALQDRELSGVLLEQAQAHLSECVECRRETEEWDIVKQALFKKRAQLPAHNILSGVMERVNQIEQGSEPSRLYKPAWPWWVPTMSLGFAFVLLFLTYLPQNQDIGIDDFLTINGNSMTVDQLLDYPKGDES